MPLLLKKSWDTVMDKVMGMDMVTDMVILKMMEKRAGGRKYSKGSHDLEFPWFD